jgi:hypothetical protein
VKEGEIGWRGKSGEGSKNECRRARTSANGNSSSNSVCGSNNGGSGSNSNGAATAASAAAATTATAAAAPAQQLQRWRQQHQQQRRQHWRQRQQHQRQRQQQWGRPPLFLSFRVFLFIYLASTSGGSRLVVYPPFPSCLNFPPIPFSSSSLIAFTIYLLVYCLYLQCTYII